MKTTDPQDELFPVVDEDDNVIGQIVRADAHKSPDIIHRAAVVLVFDEDGKMLIQRRSMTKDTSPGFWSHSVGGHVRYKEEYLPVAVRETKEEIGIVVLPKDLQLLGKIKTVSSFEQEMTSVYKYIAKKGTVFQQSEDEIDELKFVNIKTLKEMLKKDNWTPSSIQVFNAFLFGAHLPNGTKKNES